MLASKKGGRILNNQDDNRKSFDFLQSLTERSDIEPDMHFVNNLRNQLTQKSVARNWWGTKIIPFTVGSLAIVMCIVLVFLFQNNAPNDNGYTVGGTIGNQDENEDKYVIDEK